jgi:nucleotide-binding universal stress UspA family protein
MIKSILVSLDGSAASQSALREALRWAEAARALVRGVFVEDEMRLMSFPSITYVEGGLAVPTPLPEPEYRRVEAEMKKEAATIRASFDKALSAKTALKGEFASVRGDVNAALAEEARAVDLVVIGRRGRRMQGDTSHRPGPTTEAMVHDSLRPVLVVPAEGHSGSFTLFAYDGSRAAQRVAVMGAYLASLAGGPSAVLTVGDDAEDQRRTQAPLLRYLTSYGLAPKSAVERGDAKKVILEKALTMGAGLIVMGAFGHSPLRELLFGSKTLNVLEDTPCPVLMMA